jgi:hypothetical protein
VVIGHFAADALSSATPERNVVIGYAALTAVTTAANNVLVGYQAGDNITSGSNNVIVAYDQDAPTPTTSNYVNVGNTFIGDSSTGDGGVRVHAIRSTTAGIAAAGTTQGGATGLTTDVNQVATVSAGVNDSVRLPAAVAGREIIVINSSGDTLQVFPASGDQIDALAVDAATTQATLVSNRYVAYNGTNWIKF